MKLEVGKVLKAQGIKGEIKLQCYLDDSAMLADIKELYIGSVSYAVEKIRPDGAFCYVLLRGISDRNLAEAMRNKTVFADRDCIDIPKNRYFIADLIDCKAVLDDGREVGIVREVLQYGSADVFVCSDGAREVSFPFLNDLVVKVDTGKKVLILNSRRFEEVAVYEN